MASSTLAEAPPSLSAAAASALDRGDAVTGARLALAALQTDAPLAEALLLEAVMSERPVLVETGRAAFPKYESRSDVIPAHALIAADGSKIMILTNEQDRDVEVSELYALPSGRLLSRQTIPPWSYLARSPDLATLIVWEHDQVTLKDAVSGEGLFGVTLAEPYMYSWQVPNDRSRMTAIGDDILHIWDPATGSHHTESFPENSIRDRSYLSPDGRFLAGEPQWKPGSDFSKQIWDVGSRTVRLTLTDNGPIRAAFTQDSRFLVSSESSGRSRDFGWDYEVQVWNLETFEPVGNPVILKDVDQAQTLDGGRLIALTLYKSVRIFDVRTQRIVGAPGAISNISQPGWRDEGPVTIDGLHVVHTYRLDPRLRMAPADLVEQACHRWGLNNQLVLSPAEASTYGVKKTTDPCEQKAN
ncbi:hypothetical protein ABI_07530 [Asticcacaulis biprosthecium C19]|uniref:WD40 repeat domain-containing protein n=2 Tax=Asticcacaulis biprosthecium TaxID=76891 RepID=F4QLH3_9CAUL|nr:hypothetical protein ABI_07530 [Asticcacaulis biprosthecium C19]